MINKSVYDFVKTLQLTTTLCIFIYWEFIYYVQSPFFSGHALFRCKIQSFGEKRSKANARVDFSETLCRPRARLYLLAYLKVKVQCVDLINLTIKLLINCLTYTIQPLARTLFLTVLHYELHQGLEVSGVVARVRFSADRLNVCLEVFEHCVCKWYFQQK